MTTLLAVETSGSSCSLAIHADGRWSEDTQKVERLHNRVVIANLNALVARTGVGRRTFDAVAFGAGPGSFTGIRIAAAVAQGVAFASDGVVVPVSSSQALAIAAAGHPDLTGPVTELLTVTRSRRDAYYLACYRSIPGHSPERVADDALHHGPHAPELPAGGFAGVGHRPPWWPSQQPFLNGVEVTAVHIGKLALAALEHGGSDASVAPAAAFPIYVTGDSPWRPMEP